MTHQTSFTHAEFAAKKKTTRREKFLARMEEVIPWQQLLAVIEPHYPKGQRGRPPVGLERMLRVYFLQQWYGLADEALEDALYDSQALQQFARIDLSAEGVPDATTLLNFRHLLETHDLCQGLFRAINADLTARGGVIERCAGHVGAGGGVVAGETPLQLAEEGAGGAAHVQHRAARDELAKETQFAVEAARGEIALELHGREVEGNGEAVVKCAGDQLGRDGIREDHFAAAAADDPEIFFLPVRRGVVRPAERAGAARVGGWRRGRHGD